jgi:hypothetical protein
MTTTNAPIVYPFARRRHRCWRVDMADEEAHAFAQCLKRAGFSHYRQLAINDDEAHLMQTAAEQLREALAVAGFAPR